MAEIPDTRQSLLYRLRNPQDAGAWGEFLELYQPIVYRLARHHNLQDSDAKELTQEVMLAVHNVIQRWVPDREKGSFRGWLFRVARNQIINHLVRRKHQPRGTGDTQFHQMLAEHAASEDEEGSQFDLEYRRQLFRAAAERIREEFRVTTWNCFWETCVQGRGVTEVAREQGVTTGNLYVARSRVMARLRAAIEYLQREDE